MYDFFSIKRWEQQHYTKGKMAKIFPSLQQSKFKESRGRKRIITRTVSNKTVANVYRMLKEKIL